MAISLDFTPMGAVLAAGYQAGLGRYGQQQWENQFREQQLAQQDVQQQRSIAAAQYGQQQNIAADYQRQQQQLAAQQAGQFAGFAFDAERTMFNAEQQQQLQEQAQKASAIERENAARYGAMGHLMHDITSLEKEGFQYSPDQNKEIAQLEADLDTVKKDPSYNASHRADAYRQYMEQRARIRPKAPPPKPPQEVFEQSLVTMRHPETNEVVYGMLGERNGAPQFNPIKFAGEALRVKAEATQAKFADAQQKEQAAAELRQAKAQETRVKGMYTSYNTLIKDSGRIQDAVRAAIAKLPTDKEALEDGHQNYNRDEIAQQLAAEAALQLQALRRAYVLQHGKAAQVHDPELAAEFGLQPIGQGWGANPEQFSEQMIQLRDEPGMTGFDPGPMATAPGFGYRDPSGGAGWQPHMSAQEAPAVLSPEVEQQARERVVARAPAARMKLRLLEQKYGGRPPASAPEEQQLFDALKLVVDEAAAMQPAQAIAPRQEEATAPAPPSRPQAGWIPVIQPGMGGF